ncbi:MAG: RidA family protein [Candidatus Latescibacterota bacterium]|nr:RidA family protein [Candidatus Latescibacterota bacterium]
MLIQHPSGNYHFLKGIDPYSCGVVANQGFEIIHAKLSAPVELNMGFDYIANYLEDLSLERNALCAMELRSPKPYSMQGFIEFNSNYCQTLQKWGLYVDGLNPIARTNIAPQFAPPNSPQLHAFSYVTKNPHVLRKTLVVAGAGELIEGLLETNRIIRPGDTSNDAIAEKARYVLQVMTDRLKGLGGNWELINCIDVYTIYPLVDLLSSEILPALDISHHNGIHWYYSRPPVIDIDFEMDMRGTITDRVV